jgi:predicted nucleic acid-binding protein
MDSETPFRALLDAADLVIAPELVVAEVCNAFRKYVRARVLSGVQAEESAERALALVDHMQPLRDLVVEVFALTSRNDSSVYDLFYLALAQRTGATLMTADRALQLAAIRMGIETTSAHS